MNREIITINNLTIVEDEKGNKKQIDNCDNLSEILIQENIIEELENNKEELTTTILELQNKLKIMKDNYKFFKNISRVLCVVFPLLLYVISDKYGLSNLVLTNFGNLPISIFLSGVISLVGIGFLDSVLLAWKSDIKIDEKKIGGNEKQYEYITKELAKQKELLEKLHNEKEKIKTNDSHELEITKINDKDRLNDLEYYMDLYYNLGYNYDKFLKYYNNGILREKMGKRYTYEKKELIENYFKESNEKEKIKSLSLK